MEFKQRLWLVQQTIKSIIPNLSSQVRLWAPQLAFTNALGPFQVLFSVLQFINAIPESMKRLCFPRLWWMSWAWQRLCWRAIPGTTTSPRVLNVTSPPLNQIFQRLFSQTTDSVPTKIRWTCNENTIRILPVNLTCFTIRLTHRHVD